MLAELEPTAEACKADPDGDEEIRTVPLGTSIMLAEPVQLALPVPSAERPTASTQRATHACGDSQHRWLERRDTAAEGSLAWAAVP